MPTRTDRSPANRDAAIRGLPLLLDEQALMAAINARLPDIAVSRVEKKYIRYKAGMNCLVRYEFETGYGTANVYAKAYGTDAGVKLDKAGERRSVEDTHRISRLVIAEHNIAICAFPNDDKLKVLHRLGNPAARERLLTRIFPDQPAFHHASIETLQYKPERRYVACLRGTNGEQVALKFYTHKGFTAAQKVHRRLNKIGDRTFPPVLGSSRRHMAIASRWVNGSRLSDIYADPDFNIEWLRELGSGIASFHTQKDVPRLARHTSKHEAAKLSLLAQTVEYIAPEHAGQARELAQEIGSHLKSLPPASQKIHADFYAKQVLCADTGIQLLDCDDVSLGHPAEDIGLFIAHLQRDVVRGRLTAEFARKLEEEFLSGYPGATDARLHDRIQLHVAVGLLQLLHHPFRNCEPDYVERMASILTTCENRLAQYTRSQQANLYSSVLACKQPVRMSAPPSVRHDQKMPFLVQALDPDTVVREIDRNADFQTTLERAELEEIHVRRYRPGRRCLIEYGFRQKGKHANNGRLSLMGKARARGLDRRSWELNRTLYKQGFSADSDDGIAVPRPVACIPAFNMWLQEKVFGDYAWAVLSGPKGHAAAQRIAAAISKLHKSGVQAQRKHTINDELAILACALTPVMDSHPEWVVRLEQLLQACKKLAAGMASQRVTGIHRDFYHDQVIVGGRQLYLLDLDLFCMGDPALDIGNFVAHLQEQCLRERQSIDGIHDVAQSLIEGYLLHSGRNMVTAIDGYRKLTLVRHIAISQRIPERRPFTERLINLCEAQLQLNQHVPVTTIIDKRGSAICH